jgi:hypothetical protein
VVSVRQRDGILLYPVRSRATLYPAVPTNPAFSSRNKNQLLRELPVTSSVTLLIHGEPNQKFYFIRSHHAIMDKYFASMPIVIGLASIGQVYDAACRCRITTERGHAVAFACETSLPDKNR